MRLDRSQWFVKLFFWSLGIWDEFTGHNRKNQCEMNGTNLCFFIRVMLVWAPLVLLLHVVLFGSTIYILTVLPITLFGGSSYFAAIATLILLIMGIKRVHEYMKQRNEIKRSERVRKWNEEYFNPLETSPWVQESERRHGFIEVILLWLMAKKKLICPGVSFYTSNQEMKS